MQRNDYLAIITQKPSRSATILFPAFEKAELGFTAVRSFVTFLVQLVVLIAICSSIFIGSSSLHE